MKKIISLFTALLIIIFLSFFQVKFVWADACGAGRICVPSNGGSAVLVKSCVVFNNSCKATGTYSDYCTCNPSSCTCKLGPGTGCVVSESVWIYSCNNNGNPCNPFQDPDPVYGSNCGENGRCIATKAVTGCVPNTSLVTIGCCTSAGPTPTPTPNPDDGGDGGDGGETYTFTGNIYEDPNAVPDGIGGTDNLCTGDTSTPIDSTGGTVSIFREEESKAQELSGSTYDITANTDNSDYTVILNLPFPPEDPNNPWQCACNADPVDPYRCIYTNQQPDSGLTDFYIKRGSTDNSWWQTLGGSSWASGNIQSKIPFSTCSLPTCNPALILRDSLGTIDSAGFPLTNTGAVVTSESGGVYIHEADGRSSAAQAEALGVSVPLENYDYFYNKFGESAQILTGVEKPIVNNDVLGTFLYTGNLVLDETNPWYLTNDEQIVVFVNGSLTIDDTAGGENRITTVATGGDGFLMFIVSGDITITSRVGYDNIYTSASATDIANVEGVFVTDGILAIAGEADTTDKKFIGAGTFVGWTGVDLQRSFDDGSSPELNNNAATEAFIFRPDFIINAPRQVKSAQMTWREIEPSF